MRLCEYSVSYSKAKVELALKAIHCTLSACLHCVCKKNSKAKQIETTRVLFQSPCHRAIRPSMRVVPKLASLPLDCFFASKIKPKTNAAYPLVRSLILPSIKDFRVTFSIFGLSLPTSIVYVRYLCVRHKHINQATQDSKANNAVHVKQWEPAWCSLSRSWKLS